MFSQKNKHKNHLHQSAPTAALLLLLYIAATFFKAPVFFLKPRFWAEEGVVYFLQGRAINFTETLTAMPLGYLSFPANLAGWLSAQLPLYYAPIGGLAVSLAIQLLIPCVVIANQYFDNNRMKQAAFLLIPLLVFQSSETWLNSINSQFWMILAVAIIVSAPPKSNSLFVGGLNFCVALVAGLSGPGSAFLVPLFFIRALREKRVIWLLFSLASSTGALLVLNQQGNSRELSFPLDIFGIFAFFHLFFDNVCIRCAIAAHPLLREHGLIGTALAVLVFTAYLFFWRRVDACGRWLLSASMVLMVLSFASMLGKDMILDAPPFFASRYFFAPATLFFGGLLTGVFTGRLTETAIIIVFSINGIFSSFFYPVVGQHAGSTWRESVSKFNQQLTEVVYFEPGFCAFSAKPQPREDKVKFFSAAKDGFIFNANTSSIENKKLFLYRQAAGLHAWEAGAPHWHEGGLFMYGTEKYGLCYGGDAHAWAAEGRSSDGQIKILESDLGPLEGYRFLIGFGDDFAAMLAKKDYLIIEGAQLLNAQEKDALSAR